jgi:hypothetical protein
MPLQTRPVTQRRSRGARYNGPDHTWASEQDEAVLRGDVTAGLRLVLSEAKGVPARFVFVKPATAARGDERRVASLPSPQHMSIGDVCPKESEEPPQAQDQPSSSNQASPPTQDEEQAQQDEDEDQDDEPPQEEDNDQGEMKMIKTRKMIKRLGINDRHTQESTKQFNEITTSTPFLVTFIRGNH